MPAKGICQDLSNCICAVLNRIKVIEVTWVFVVLDCIVESINLPLFVHMDTLTNGLNDFGCACKVASSLMHFTVKETLSSQGENCPEYMAMLEQS